MTGTRRLLSAQKIASFLSKASVGFTRDKESLNSAKSLKHREELILWSRFLLPRMFILREHKMWFFKCYVSDSKMLDVKTYFPCSLGLKSSLSKWWSFHTFISQWPKEKTDVWCQSFSFMRNLGNCFKHKYFSPDENISGLNIWFLQWLVL